MESMDVTTHVQNHIVADTVSSMCLNFGVKNFPAH